MKSKSFLALIVTSILLGGCMTAAQRAQLLERTP